MTNKYNEMETKKCHPDRNNGNTIAVTQDCMKRHKLNIICDYGSKIDSRKFEFLQN